MSLFADGIKHNYKGTTEYNLCMFIRLCVHVHVCGCVVNPNGKQW